MLKVQHRCYDPNHIPYPHHHGPNGQAHRHRNPDCPWKCGEEVYTKIQMASDIVTDEPGPAAITPMLTQKPLPDYDAFRTDLTKLINYHSMENGSDTRDFVLAEYLVNVLKAYDASRRNEEHYKK